MKRAIVLLLLLLVLFCQVGAGPVKWVCLDSNDVLEVTYVKQGHKKIDTVRQVYYNYSSDGGYKLVLLNGNTVYTHELKSVGTVGGR